ncbi:Gfo/Idh/MocA family oxidoreductase [Chamaesiphon sp. OTE_20_metabat_361]|uniref:Gfo/Idh/MocA family protein n=1 Tax=Chamaesiphon sp. OTE_20_metabat_361 TaxID=2964689 RepID=UPI00286AEAF3|nr:Gfo/Idh/MocA family oxidoreductase [Chamaesiphon sp. OTE_20_metabat_361]
MTTQDRYPATDAQKIRYAVVGLGWFAQAAALPAFANTENSQVVALVSDNPTKRSEVAKKYGIAESQTYTYAQYDDLLNSGTIDAVYIALPNQLHCDYTVRAAQAGVHILCEKPMAVTVAECEQMIAAAQEHNVKLAIAYRLHFDAANLQAVEIVKSGQIGEPRFFHAIFAQQTEGANSRMKAETGSGTIEDIGIYCINAARYLFQSEPISVFATSASKPEERFREVAEMTSAIMQFPGDRLASFTCSFGAAKLATYQVMGTGGNLHVEPAFASQADIKHVLAIDDQPKQERIFPACDQLAAVFTYFSDCVLHDKQPAISGREGLIDLKIICAIKESIATAKFVSIDGIESPQHRPTAAQIIERPPLQQQPQLVNAADPAGKS